MEAGPAPSEKQPPSKKQSPLPLYPPARANKTGFTFWCLAQLGTGRRGGLHRRPPLLGGCGAC
eukprot:3349025-Pyramimonas_sp.AAC.1